jgi:hypothetical protein
VPSSRLGRAVVSILAFTEHLFGLAPLGGGDASAYDYADSFSFTQPARPGVPLGLHPIPAAERRWLRAHPMNPDDPT